MIIFINDNLEIHDIPDLTLGVLIEKKNISPKGTAIACNGKLVPRDKWNSFLLNDNDKITIISAAFGG